MKRITPHENSFNDLEVVHVKTGVIVDKVHEKELFCFTTKELEALLQKERREAAEKALYKGHKIGLSGYLENSCVVEYEIKIYLDQHYPLPQPPKQ